MNYDTFNVFPVSKDYYLVRGSDPQQDSVMLAIHGFGGAISYRVLALIIILGL